MSRGGTSGARRRTRRLRRGGGGLQPRAMSVPAAKKHLHVVCALIERDGRVLVAQRPAEKAQGLLWEFPGGKLEDGESAEAALVREIREELCVEVALGERLADAVHDYGKFAITLTPFRATLGESGADPHATEHVALRWCVPEELRGLSWAPADVPIVEAYLARRG